MTVSESVTQTGKPSAQEQKEFRTMIMVEYSGPGMKATATDVQPMSIGTVINPGCHGEAMKPTELEFWSLKDLECSQ